MQLSSIRQFIAGAALATAIGVGGAGMALAQDTTPANGHPAHIHMGTCAELDPVPAAPLQNLLPLGVERDDSGEVSETPEVRGTLTVGDLTYSETDDIEFSWDNMLAEPHAIVVHESEDNMDNYIACGDIGGVVFDDDDMVIGMKPVGDSGFSGIAMLSSDDDGEVDVEIYLSAPAGGTDTGGDTVAATPEG